MAGENYICESINICLCVPLAYVQIISVYFMCTYMSMLCICISIDMYICIFGTYTHTYCTSFLYESSFAFFLMYMCFLIYNIPTNRRSEFRMMLPAYLVWYVVIHWLSKLSSYHIPGIILKKIHIIEPFHQVTDNSLNALDSPEIMNQYMNSIKM